MGKLDELKNAKSLSNLAILLGFIPRGLSYTLYKSSDAEKYSKFQIPKKSGGVRDICAPQGRLKLLQRNLADLLYDCCDEINGSSPLPPLSHGFRRKQSIIDNARKHRRRRFVLNIDLQDFFPSFNFGRVRGFFIKNHDFAVAEKVATVIAQIACFENMLPQGSPSSPIIADMIAHILDVRLVQLAKRHHVVYSRYADDLTFSTNQKGFPTAIAFREDKHGSEWILGQDLIGVIKASGFTINTAKTRMQVRAGRQVVTGLTVNTKVNVPQDYAHSARAMCNSVFRTGAYHRRGPVNPSSQESAVYEMISDLKPLSGILSYIYHIKLSSALRGQSRTHVQTVPVSGEELYRQFLFFEYFVALRAPIVICEGRTDNVYLKYAIRHLSSSYPHLCKVSEPNVKSLVTLFNYENRVHKVMELGGGFTALQKFVGQYPRRVKRYQHRPMLHPVLVLVH